MFELYLFNNWFEFIRSLGSVAPKQGCIQSLLCLSICLSQNPAYFSITTGWNLLKSHRELHYQEELCIFLDVTCSDSVNFLPSSNKLFQSCMLLRGAPSFFLIYLEILVLFVKRHWNCINKLLFVIERHRVVRFFYLYKSIFHPISHGVIYIQQIQQPPLCNRKDH